MTFLLSGVDPTAKLIESNSLIVLAIAVFLFWIFFLYRDTSSNVLQFSAFQKPLDKYLYIPVESFHPSSNKKAFIKGELMRYARNNSSFNSFYDTREKFWK